MTDLVQRLRSLAVINPQIPNDNVTACRICDEAAHEIELLRRQVKHLENLVDGYKRLIR